MELQTVRFGTIPIQEDKVISFPKGILGFTWNKKYILLPHGENSPFLWLQSAEDGDLAFVVMSPTYVKTDYTIDIEQDVLDELGTDQTEDLEILCIVTIPQGKPEDMTINLLGPIIINARSRCAVQVITDTGKYSHRYPVLAGKNAG
ncbi:MAG: flagellar assembly protein FliW [Desulfomonilia bacterium]|nr:flagellar assembly protein FliW [Desulfomonilia bacterium]